MQENQKTGNIDQPKKYIHITLITFAATCLFYVVHPGQSLTGITGPCDNCHTMHNSQNGSPMTFDDTETPNAQLLRATCYGCHAQGGTTATVNIGTNKVPQVMHSGETSLAGGNFGYINGMAGTGASSAKGHNIVDLTGADSVFKGIGKPPPGALGSSSGNPHPSWNFLRSDILGCAGRNGCHGYRAVGGSAAILPNGVNGAHHSNVGGKLDAPTTPANSYRFLDTVKGFEDPDWQENPSSGNHNEYFALAAPIQLGCDGVGGMAQCHIGPGGPVRTPDGTMSQFCATCHGNLHTLATETSDGIGSTASSPFMRHPTDLSLPSTGEYAAYTAYDLKAPVARLTVPDDASGAVSPGSDAVMCLSCHVAHASDYPDMLRWDYDTCDAGTTFDVKLKCGCFSCHSTKN